MILAASVCTRSGKVLLSRQFEELAADKIQELFGNFGKLAQQGAQHTTIENDDVRYVYEPLEDLFVVLVTDLSSNILQDIRTLHLVAQCVASQVRTATESEISENAFEIIFALDEIVNNGYSDNLTLSQVDTFLEMESHAEKIQEIIERNKELEAAETRKQKARELDMQRKAKRGFGDGSSSPFVDLGTTPSFNSMSPAPASVASFSSAATPNSNFKPALGKSNVAPKGRSLQLGKKKEDSSPLLFNLPQATTAHEASAAAATATAPAASAPTVVATPEGVEVSIQETLTVEATRNGDVRSARVAGSLHLFAGDRENTSLRIKTKTSGPPNAYKTNPKMDRGLFASDRVLSLRNAQEAFPASNVLLLKWTVDNINVPVTFSVWVSQSPDPGFSSITVEYELADDFVDTIENVNVAIPLPHANAHVSDPSSIYEQADDHIVWMIPVINSANPSGTFDFTAEADSEESFFPLQATFTIKNASTTFGQIEVEAVESQSTGALLQYDTQSVAEATSYHIR